MEFIKKELSEKNNNGSSKKSVIGQMVETAKKQLRIPMSKPEVYKPLLLIITITSLQHFSGFTFTKKFLLQILAPSKKLEGEVGGEVVSFTNPLASGSEVGNLSSGEVANDPEKEEEYTGYYFAILINIIRTVANLLMSDFLKRSKVAKIQGVFFTGAPPKSFKYKKVNLG